MEKTRAVALLCLLFALPLFGAERPKRQVVDNVLASSDVPKIRITVDKSLKYLGSFHFNLRNIAEGERYIWAEAENGRVKRMFIVQLEGFLPDTNKQYRYRMRTPVKLGHHTYSHNLWFYDDEVNRVADPPNEATRTVTFLAERGLRLDSDLMMSRFERILGDDKRNEAIFLYWENLRDHNLTAKDFPEETPTTPEQKRLGQELFERSLKAFSVED